MKTEFLMIFGMFLFGGFSGIVFADESPDSTCIRSPKPDGEGWVFVDCQWKQYADVPVYNCQKGKAPANNYTWNSQDCLWEWSPLRNENSSGPPPTSSINQKENTGDEFTEDEICGSGNILVNGVCKNLSILGNDTGFNQIVLFVFTAGIMSITFIIIWRKKMKTSLSL